MSPASFLRSTSFRLLAWYAGLFVASVAILFVIVYWITIAALEQQLSDSVERESQVLTELYRSGNSERMVRAIQLRMLDLRPPRRYYLLQDREGERIAGNLPPMKPVEGEWAIPVSALTPNPSLRRDELVEAHPVVAVGTLLDDGEFLLVGESQYRAVKAREAIILAFGWGFAITVLLAGGGGVALGSGFLRRIDEVNRTAHSIMDGNLSLRLPARGGGSEMDELALNFNAMLDRIEALMGSIKQVSDDIAHDLRTPLSRLRHRLETARDKAEGEGAVIIEQSIDELDAILATFSALLRIGQIEAGARRAAFAEIRLDQIAAAVVEAYAPVAEDRGQRLLSELRAFPVIRGDRELLMQMVANLVENAINHCPADVTIRVGLDSTAGQCVFSVADSGSGIPATERDAVLRRFYRLEQSRTTPGSGLGLALVKAIADLHGATVTLADNDPGLRVSIRFRELVVSAGHA
jgi:signal transduction histidine kinase